jgi:hypothetical protein
METTQKTAPVLPGTRPGAELETIRTTGGYYRVDAEISPYELMDLLKAHGVLQVWGREEG